MSRRSLMRYNVYTMVLIHRTEKMLVLRWSEAYDWDMGLVDKSYSDQLTLTLLSLQFLHPRRDFLWAFRCLTGVSLPVLSSPLTAIVSCSMRVNWLVKAHLAGVTGKGIAYLRQGDNTGDLFLRSCWWASTHQVDSQEMLVDDETSYRLGGVSRFSAYEPGFPWNNQ